MALLYKQVVFHFNSTLIENFNQLCKHKQAYRISHYQASWSNYTMKITTLGVEIRIQCVNEYEAGCEKSKMEDDELIAWDLP